MGLFGFGKKINNYNETEDDYDDDSHYSDYPPDYATENPKCPSCRTRMKYNYVTSKFKCFSCGYDMDEYDWDYDISEDGDEPPYGCEACGGPWPHCKSSCNLIDD